MSEIYTITVSLQCDPWGAVKNKIWYDSSCLSTLKNTSTCSGKTPPLTGVKRSLNVRKNSAKKPLFGANKSAEYMAEHQLAPELKRPKTLRTGKVCAWMGNTRATQQKGRQVPKDEAVDEII